MATSKKDISEKEAVKTVKVIVEIVIKREDQQPDISKFKLNAFSDLRPVNHEETPPNFEYFFTANGLTVDRLLINSRPFNNPGDTGKVYAPVYIETIQVIVDGTVVNPVASGTLQLKYFGKDVFASPQQLDIKPSGSAGLNLPNVPLPL